MNRTSNTIENTDSKPTTQPVFNYAQAAKRSSKILDQATQRPKSASPNSASQPNSTPPVAPGNAAPFRGKSTANVNVHVNRGSSESGNTKNSNSYPFKSHTNPPHSPTHTSLTSEPNRRSKRSSVQLPKAPPNRTQSPLQFGSINQSSQAAPQQPVFTHHKEVPTVTPTEVTFGSISVDDASSAPAQPDRNKNLTQPAHPVAETRPPPQTSQPPPTHQYNHGHRPRPPFSKPNKHYPTSPMPHQQPGYSPPPTFGYPSNPYPYYPPYIPNVPVRPQSKAIRIVDPNTGAEVKTQSLLSSSPVSSKDSSGQEDRKQTDIKDSSSQLEKKPVFEHKSRAIPIVDPAIKERQEREKREKEEAERKAKEDNERLEQEAREKEEAERVEREKREKEEAERKVREEAERKEREEAERVEREKREKEEAERKVKEEAERKVKEEAERKVKEEAERKAKQEAELKAKEETERLAKEEADRLAKEASDRQVKEEKERKEQKEKEEQERKEAEKQNKEDSAETAAEEKGSASNKPKHTPNRLDLSAIPAHVLSETPIQSPMPIKPKSTRDMPKIDDFDAIKYPDHVNKIPQGANSGRRIRYNAEFLLAFQALCTDTAADLSIFQNVGDDSYDRGSRGGMQRRQTSERGRPRTPGSPMEMFKHGSRDGRMDIGKFGGRQMSHRSGSGSHGLPPPGSPGGMQREGSQGGRSRSGRGGKGRHQKEQQGGPTIPLDQVVPLEKGENRWVPTSQTGAAKVAEGELVSQDVIVRKVNSLLNKLTLEKFESVSDQIWSYAEQSTKEENGESLQTVIELMFTKACDEAAFASMWAQLSRKLFDKTKTHDDIKDVNHKDKHGNPVHGGALFRKYLLNRCQAGFERGWKLELPTSMDATEGEIMMTDEYYAAVKAKRRGLGLVQFIGELFKLEMLTDRIMMDCMRRLLNDPGEEEIETMCKLLTTVGKRFETTSKTCKGYMDTYMETIKDILNPTPDSPMLPVNARLSSRVKFMLQDVVDLRRGNWKPRSGTQTGPTTLAKVHEEAQKAKNEEKEAIKRSPSSRGSIPPLPISRQGSHRGGGRSIQREDSKGSPLKPTDGWNTVSSPGGSLRGRPSELSGFSKADRNSKSRGDILSPTGSPFASLSRSPKSGEKGSPVDSRGASPGPATGNMFDALGDEGHHEADAGTERKKLQLLPRGTTLEGDKSSSPLVESTTKPKINVERHAKESIKEYFNSGFSSDDKKALRECITELGSTEDRVVFVSVMIGYVEGKQKDIDMICTMFQEFSDENFFERDTYIKAFQPLIKSIREDDIFMDVPKAPDHIARFLVAMGLKPSDIVLEGTGDDENDLLTSEELTSTLEKKYEKALQASEQ